MEVSPSSYPHRMLGRGIGINALVVAVSAAVGPTLAAGILATATWPYLFAINIPFGIAAVVIGMRALPHTSRGRHVFDWQSALMSAIIFGLGIAAIDSVGHGEAPLLYLSEAGIAAVAGAGRGVAYGAKRCRFHSPNNRTMFAAAPVRICIGISKWNSRLK